MTAPLVEEVAVSLTLNGAAVRQWRCTPYDLEALAIGRLFIDGLIGRADAVHLIIERTGDAALIQARMVEGVALVRTSPSRSLPVPTTEIFGELFRALFLGVDARHEQGGMHAAAATDGLRIIKQVEDVGRHNTVDKLVGALLLEHLQPADFGLLTSSRVSGEIADKAARAGFAWLASRSIPTTMAVSLALAAHMPIIGRAPSRDAYVYS
ncbi:MAG TPA: formate dehydrogenase accessory sulfurtransferase FdhD [Longimicrobiales bacterium]|nr:formate dehydrogenase accessory sulfurtransferase FdhD [Longimicrobiales bacterium]